MADPLPRPADYIKLPLDDWIEVLVKDMLVPNLRPAFQAIRWPVEQVLSGFDVYLQAVPFLVFVVVAGLIAWRAAGIGVAAFAVVSMVFLDLVGIWTESMTTLAMIMTSVLFCAMVGIPLGIIAGRSDGFAAGIRPIIDIMQATPAFVYLVPVVMLFGIGIVPGVIATIIFSMPPIIRLTNLGIRQVPGGLVEAGYSLGLTRAQVLWKIQMPLAMCSIMAGLNQTLMMSLSMVVIAALIGARGLGLVVFQGIGRLDIGLAALGGIGVVLIAIVLDRITQALARHRPGTVRQPGIFARLASRLRLGRHEASGKAHTNDPGIT